MCGPWEGTRGGLQKPRGCRQAPGPLWASDGLGDRGSGICWGRDSPRLSPKWFLRKVVNGRVDAPASRRGRVLNLSRPQPWTLVPEGSVPTGPPSPVHPEPREDASSPGLQGDETSRRLNNRRRGAVRRLRVGAQPRAWHGLPGGRDAG